MKLAILGTVGVPGRYGGFETLAENLVTFHDQTGSAAQLTVYCSQQAYPDTPPRYLSAQLRYSRLKANGVQSILYDAITLFDAVRRGNDQILLLGVSGAIALPFVRLFSRVRIVTNIDGIEWKRDKWRPLARRFLRWSEQLAIRNSHVVIADNQAIADYIFATYGVTANLIAYGGDHAVQAPMPDKPNQALPKTYAMSLCRIEPENNIDIILEAFSRTDQPLVFVGNWGNSDYGKALRARFSRFQNIHMLDPVYDPSQLRQMRAQATAYIHGHSAGGTNPALVEMMSFGVPVFAFDCAFNRFTTEDGAHFFKSADDLVESMAEQTPTTAKKCGARMYEIAERRYTWEKISRQYFDLLELEPTHKTARRS